MKSVSPNADWRTCNDVSFRMLEGRLLTDIETLGLPEKQENAIKSLIKSDIWQIWLEEMVYVKKEFIQKILEVNTLDHLEDAKDMVEGMKE